LFRQKEIKKQHINRQKKIVENFNSSKKIIYLISFPSGELADDFKKFLAKEEIEELTIVHHDKIHSKTWEAEYNIKRIDEWITEKKKTIKVN